MENEIKKSKSPIILGAISLVAWVIPIIGVVISIVGIIMSIKKSKEGNPKGYKLALILNIIGLVLCLINWGLTILLLFRR